jgi:hypothetical protein
MRVTLNGVLGVYGFVRGAGDPGTPVTRPAAPAVSATPLVPPIPHPPLPTGDHDVRWMLQELGRRQVDQCRSVNLRAQMNGYKVDPAACGPLPTGPAVPAVPTGAPAP